MVAVRCDSREDLNIPPFGGQIDFLTYGGIYRAVSLDVKEPAYLRDIFIEAQAEGDFRIYSSTVGETIGCTLQAEIRSPAGSRALYSSGELSLPIVGTLNGVHPWSVEHPSLYTLTVRLIRPGTGGLPDRVLDEKSTRFGFRTIQFVAGGLYLNGQRVELRGLNRHQSYAYQGYAMPDSIQQLDAQILKKKQLGCNAVRTSHYPQSPAFLDACDELGLLAFVEMPGWQHIGDEMWQAQALQNCREMVCQCRNHPSVFLWGVRVNGSADHEAFTAAPTRPSTGWTPPARPGACGSPARASRSRTFTPTTITPTPAGARAASPGLPLRLTCARGISSASSAGQQFPAKTFDDEPHRLVQALRHAAVLNDAIAQPGVAGSFGWCMADYNTHREFGSGDRICYHGVTDLFRTPKLSAAVYASQKTPRSPFGRGVRGLFQHGAGRPPRRLCRGLLGVHQRRERPPLPGQRFHCRVHPRPPGALCRPAPPAHRDPGFRGLPAGKVRGHGSGRSAPGGRHPERDAAGRAEPLALSRARMLSLRLSANDLLRMYYKYIGVLGGPSSVYRFEAVWHGRTVRTVVASRCSRSGWNAWCTIPS